MCARKVFVGLSGGVDSSVSAALLVAEGYDVTGVYMKNWSRDLPGMKCPWAEDLADAKRVAVKLGIDFRVFDFEREYKHKVVDYMVAEYKAGRTPNPDIMCNQEVKFRLFFDAARGQGADYIATGHYARTLRGNPMVSSQRSSAEPSFSQAKNQATCSPSLRDDESGAGEPTQLLCAVDENKDQTYFLYRAPQTALDHTLFPVGGLTKPEVRALAEQYGLATATKKESMGVCFVGSVGIREFLGEYVEPQLGDIVDEATGKIVGQHDGAIFYTIGQRHGLNVGGGLPYYVVRKDMAANVVYITTDLNNQNLWQTELRLRDVVYRGDPKHPKLDLLVRTRHRAPLVKATLELDGSNATVRFADEQRAVAPGQSVVFYDGEVCLGGGIV
jgi:tRNA-specific 2-thiouridylase